MCTNHHKTFIKAIKPSNVARKDGSYESTQIVAIGGGFRNRQTMQEPRWDVGCRMFVCDLFLFFCLFLFVFVCVLFDFLDLDLQFVRLVCLLWNTKKKKKKKKQNNKTNNNNHHHHDGNGNANDKKLTADTEGAWSYGSGSLAEPGGWAHERKV